jgi:hypothetical protein
VRCPLSVHLPQDVDSDTVLILLAETKGASVTSPYRPYPDGPSVGATVRMAKLYYDRYPETLDWSNAKGRTALHVAALKGNEDLVEVGPLHHSLSPRPLTRPTY